VLALVLLIIVMGGAFARFWSEHHFDAAKQALERYDLDDAQHHFDLYLRIRPNNWPIRFLAAQTARRRDAYEEAESHLAACEQVGGMKHETNLERIMLTAQRGDLERVEGLLKARTGPDDPEAVLALEALAKGFLNRFWLVHARVCLNILLERQPDHPQALLMRARLFEALARSGAMEHEQDALRDYEKAVALHPSFQARLGLAGALYRVGRPWEAAVEYERLHQEEPENPHALFGLGRCSYRLHELDSARQLFDEVIKQLASQPLDTRQNEANKLLWPACLERGRLDFHEGDLAEAEKCLRQAAELAPLCEFEPLRFLHQCLETAGKDEEARQCQERLREREAELLRVNRLIVQTNRDPNNVPLRYEIAVDLLRVGREEDGVAGLYFVLDQDPRYGPAHEAVANYFERTGQLQRSTRHRRAGNSGASGKRPAG